MKTLIIISLVMVFGTLLPLNRNKHWFIRDQTYFRAYYLLMHVFLFFCYCINFDKLTWTLLLCIVHFLCALICFRSIRAYFFFSSKSIPDANKDDLGDALKCLIFNVLYGNENYKDFINVVNDEAPDLVLLLEPGKDWEDGIQELYHTYPYVIKEIREDTYGILLMSKMPFAEQHLNHIVTRDIPSVEVLLKMGGHDIRIYGLHPKPPLPGEAETSLSKDLELLFTATKIQKNQNKEFDILIGDLNDVGWSNVAKRFKKITGMKDPREGRGFYSTFPTYLPFRIPIDHVFCSPGLSLIDFRILKNIGSDHYPVIVSFLIPPKG